MIPTPPATTDPITWIALALVSLLIVSVLGSGAWIGRYAVRRITSSIDDLAAAVREQAASGREERTAMLTRFSEELAIARLDMRQATTEDRRVWHETTGRIFDRLEGMNADLLAGKGCRRDVRGIGREDLGDAFTGGDVSSSPLS